MEGLLADTDALTKVLRYHVAAGTFLAADLTPLTALEMLSGDEVSLQLLLTGLVLNETINGTTSDVIADNGVIHVIDGVLLPPATSECDPQSVGGIAAASEDFATLVTAVEAAGLLETLCGDGTFTVFAPTNAAFEALPEGTLEALLEDTEALKNILLYHVAGETLLAADVVGLNSIAMLNEDSVSIEVTDAGLVLLNGSVTITVTDIVGTNGVIHVIDGVLLPPASEEEGGEVAEEGGEVAEEGGEVAEEGGEVARW